MPTLPANHGVLPPEAKPTPPSDSHLADTGHTIQTHTQQHVHVFAPTCLQCGHTATFTEQPLLYSERENPAAMAVFAADPDGTLHEMPAKTHLLNTMTGVLHDRSMLTERCNTDQIEYHSKRVSRDEAELKADPRFRKLCSYCHPTVIENPADAEADSPG